MKNKLRFLHITQLQTMGGKAESINTTQVLENVNPTTFRLKIDSLAFRKTLMSQILWLP